MREIVKRSFRYDFVSKFKATAMLSGAVMVISYFFILRGINYGVDFRGGAEIMLNMGQGVELSDLRDSLKKGGFSGAVVQTIGAPEENEFLIKVKAGEENLNQVTDEISALLRKDFAGQKARIDKIDIVGPKAGERLRTSGFLAMFWALIAILGYIALRFDFKYSPGAIVALFHDVSIILGIFSLFQVEFTLQIVAALLAVIGYSVNDTVVIYDRVREHEQTYLGKSLSEHINNAISETLSRTVLTSGTTLFISFMMYFFGGQSIKSFFLAISIGVVIGTYSSIFVAAPVTLFFDRMKQKKLQNA